MSLRAITDAANDLAALLEATAPKGLKHPRHAVSVAPARRSIEVVIAHYFYRQRKAVLAAVKPHIERQLILHPTVKESSANGKTFARTLLPSSLHPLQFSATAGETSEYNDAITELIGAAAKSLGSTAGEDLASTYLRENSLSKLTGGLNATTTERLQDALATAWDEGGSYDQMVAAIQDFDGFSEQRAGLVAQQETSEAYNSARQSIAASLGYNEKSSEVESDNPCEDCIENADEGWIDSDAEFPNGGDAPPFHVNCQCAVNFRKAIDSDDEEE